MRVSGMVQTGADGSENVAGAGYMESRVRTLRRTRNLLDWVPAVRRSATGGCSERLELADGRENLCEANPRLDGGKI